MSRLVSEIVQAELNGYGVGDFRARRASAEDLAAREKVAMLAKERRGYANDLKTQAASQVQRTNTSHLAGVEAAQKPIPLQPRVKKARWENRPDFEYYAKLR